MTGREAWSYCANIRNKDKRQYAFAWLAWLEGRARKPEQPPNLSGMGAQAVRLMLGDGAILVNVVSDIDVRPSAQKGGSR